MEGNGSWCRGIQSRRFRDSKFAEMKRIVQITSGSGSISQWKGWWGRCGSMRMFRTVRWRRWWRALHEMSICRWFLFLLLDEQSSFLFFMLLLLLLYSLLLRRRWQQSLLMLFPLLCRHCGFFVSYWGWQSEERKKKNFMSRWNPNRGESPGTYNQYYR